MDRKVIILWILIDSSLVLIWSGLMWLISHNWAWTISLAVLETGLMIMMTSLCLIAGDAGGKDD